MKYAQVRSGGHIVRMGGHTNYFSGNGNAFFLLSNEVEWQGVEDGGAIEW